MKTRLALGALVLGALSLPAMAADPFQAQVDCGGHVIPPATEPFTLRFENQTQQNQALDVTVHLTLPSGRDITLRQAMINLRPNQDRRIEQTLNIPENAPAGDYTITVVATTDAFATFDTCSFNVD